MIKESALFMQYVQWRGLGLCLFEILDDPAVGHAVTTRAGGCSRPPWDSLNLSFGVEDAPENVRENRRRLARALGLSPQAICTAHQVHGSTVTVIKDKPLMKACAEGAHKRAADAIITNVPGLGVMVLVADCVPILLYDSLRGAVGAVHAGWRGTLDGVAAKTVGAFCRHFGSDPRDLVAAIGPSIGPCCFEVGDDVAARFGSVSGLPENVVRSRPGGRCALDLRRANQAQLLCAGLKETHIQIAETCTCCDPSGRFFSYRRDEGHTGRFGAGVFIRSGSA